MDREQLTPEMIAREEEVSKQILRVVASFGFHGFVVIMKHPGTGVFFSAAAKMEGSAPWPDGLGQTIVKLMDDGTICDSCGKVHDGSSARGRLH